MSRRSYSFSFRSKEYQSFAAWASEALALGTAKQCRPPKRVYCFHVAPFRKRLYKKPQDFVVAGHLLGYTAHHALVLLPNLKLLLCSRSEVFFCKEVAQAQLYKLLLQYQEVLQIIMRKYPHLYPVSWSELLAAARSLV